LEANIIKMKAALLQELSPSIHWAQFHVRNQGARWHRSIYDFQILHVLQGELQVTFPQHQTPVMAGQLILIPANLFHEVKVVSDPDAHLLGIHFDFFQELTPKRDDEIIVDERDPKFDCFCAMPDIDGAPLFPHHYQISPPVKLVSCMESAIQEWTERKPGYELSCKGWMLQIFTLLLRSRHEQMQVMDPKYKGRLVELVHALDTKFHRKWTNTEMARMVHVHEDYMSRIFKLMMGMSPNKYLQSIRHRHARQLLRETDLKIEAIAAEVGYDDLHYFSRMFKKWEGISAYEYRQFARNL
jgi:AraC-like DNA-binding protein/mannose-6-phosphate isomerase-like protein (cupin superfamily)